VGRFKSELACAKDALHRAQERQRKYADLNRRHAEFSLGDNVLLSTQHITLKVGEGSTLKLCPRFIGPFQVLQVLSPVAYKLKLPSSMKCHPVFHISLLRPADTESALFPEREQPAPPPVRVDNNQAYYSIDYIMGHEPKTAQSHEEARKYLTSGRDTHCGRLQKSRRNIYTRMYLMLLKTTGPIALKIHLSQIPNNHHRHTDHLLNSTHNIHHTCRYRIFSSQQRTAKDNASPGTAEEIDELLNALVLSQVS